MPRFTRNERLSSKKIINELFEKGVIFYSKPFKVIWMPADTESPSPAQILISIPKRNVRLAVMRNLMKRRIREIYRKNKEPFYEKLGKMNRKCLLAFIYTGREPIPSSELEPKIIVILQRLIQEHVKDIR